MRNPDVKTLEILARLATDPSAAPFRAWLAANAEDANTVLMDAATSGETVHVYRGRCQALRELTRTMDGAGEALLRMRNHAAGNTRNGSPTPRT